MTNSSELPTIEDSPKTATKEPKTTRTLSRDSIGFGPNEDITPFDANNTKTDEDLQNG